MSAPRVSVCIVTFNHEKYIRECVLSVIRQAEDVDIEILVGDDQSTDGTQAIMESLQDEFPNLVRYRRNPRRLGPAGNYQSLIKESRGSLIAHLDGDDLWVPGKLAVQVEYMDRQADCPAVYTNAIAINEDGAHVGLFNNPQPERIDIDTLIARGNFLCHSSILYRAVLKDEILAFSQPFIDYRIHINCARHGELAYINKAMVKYRVNSLGSVLTHQNENIRKLYWEAFEAIPPGAVSKKALASGIAEFGRSVFFASLKKRDWLLLTTWLPKAIGASPVGQMSAVLLIVKAIARTGAIESYYALVSLFGHGRPKIMYRH